MPTEDHHPARDQLSALLAESGQSAPGVLRIVASRSIGAFLLGHCHPVVLAPLAGKHHVIAMHGGFPRQDAWRAVGDRAMNMACSVLVTGGNRGIGLAIARRFAADGDGVTVTSRSGDPVDGLSTVRCDVRDAASVDAAFGAVEADQGPVEVLVANAGVTRDTLLAPGPVMTG